MGLHSDLVMYDVPQTEMVYTIRNDSDSEFQWIDSKHRLHSFRPQANDLVLVRANGPFHGVTPVHHGSRDIVKFVGHAPHARPVMSFKHQLEQCPRDYSGK